ncbi:transposase, partial [Thiolapillus sp.]|uniref:transposase n=1 Tax=Thiolapillus sp. TaxID=2017437 RepID=UPI003AF45164
YAREIIGDSELLEPVRKALATLENHAERVVRRWTSTYTNARMEGLNSLFQAARARARGYRNNRTFMTMIYMHDLHDCQPGGFHTEIHMKRRRA